MDKNEYSGMLKIDRSLKRTPDDDAPSFNDIAGVEFHRLMSELGESGHTVYVKMGYLVFKLIVKTHDGIVRETMDYHSHFRDVLDERMRQDAYIITHAIEKARQRWPDYPDDELT